MIRYCVGVSILAVWATALLTSCAGSPFVRTSPSPSPTFVNTDQRCKGVKPHADRTVDRIAVYRWRKSGANYVPEPTGLDGSLATSAKFNPAPLIPEDRSVIVTFNTQGQRLLDQLSAEAATASRSGTIDTPEGHLAVLVGLTDEQLAGWSDPSVRQKALTPVEQGGNLLANPVVRQPLTGNELMVYFGKDLPTACSLTAMRR